MGAKGYYEAYNMLKYQTKRAIVLFFGIVFLILGVLGLALPFLQGILFIAIGLLLLSVYSPTVRTFLDRHTVRYPKLHQTVLKVEDWIKRILGENGRPPATS